MYVGILFPNLHKTLVGVWNQHITLSEHVWNVGEWVLRASIEVYYSKRCGKFEFLWCVGQTGRARCGGAGDRRQCSFSSWSGSWLSGGGVAGPWWGVQGPALDSPDCPVVGVQGPGGGCRAPLLTVLTVRCPGRWGCMMPGDDGRGGARLPPPSSVSLPDNNKYNSVTTSNQTRQHQPQPAHTEVQSDKIWLNTRPILMLYWKLDAATIQNTEIGFNIEMNLLDDT